MHFLGAIWIILPNCTVPISWLLDTGSKDKKFCFLVQMNLSAVCLRPHCASWSQTPPPSPWRLKTNPNASQPRIKIDCWAASATYLKKREFGHPWSYIHENSKYCYTSYQLKQYLNIVEITDRAKHWPTGCQCKYWCHKRSLKFSFVVQKMLIAC